MLNSVGSCSEPSHGCWQWQGYEIATIFEICTAAGMVLNHSNEGGHSLVSVILLLFDYHLMKVKSLKPFDVFWNKVLYFYLVIVWKNLE